MTEIDPLDSLPVLNEADITETSFKSSIGESEPIRTLTPSSNAIGSKLFQDCRFSNAVTNRLNLLTSLYSC